jgi:hypothetical protein
MLLFYFYFTHLHQAECEERVLLCHLSPSVCFMVYMWTISHFFPFYPCLNFSYREKTVYCSPVFLSCHLYMRLFSHLKFKESWFSTYWNVLFLKSKHCSSMSDAWVSCVTMLYKSKLFNSSTY